MLSQTEKDFLHRVARETLEIWVREKCKPVFEAPPGPLRDPRGAFVTLTHEGTLRGCVGVVEAMSPLYETVRDMTASAATSDFRFPAVRPGDLPGITVEISALSPLSPLEDPAGILVGETGLMIRKGAKSGLLLPQVAAERGWDAETFLDQTCWKAGLPPGSWRDPATEIWVFSAEVF